MLEGTTWIWNGRFGFATAKKLSSLSQSPMFWNSLSYGKKHHLSRRCALLFSDCSSFFGLGPFWQLVDFLCRKQCVQGIELSSETVWFFWGSFQSWWSQELEIGVQILPHLSFGFCLKNDSVNKCDSLLTGNHFSKMDCHDSTKEKFGRPHRFQNQHALFSSNNEISYFLCVLWETYLILGWNQVTCGVKYSNRSNQ